VKAQLLAADDLSMAHRLARLYSGLPTYPWRLSSLICDGRKRVSTQNRLQLIVSCDVGMLRMPGVAGRSFWGIPGWLLVACLSVQETSSALLRTLTQPGVRAMVRVGATLKNKERSHNTYSGEEEGATDCLTAVLGQAHTNQFTQPGTSSNAVHLVLVIICPPPFPPFLLFFSNYFADVRSYWSLLAEGEIRRQQEAATQSQTTAATTQDVQPGPRGQHAGAVRRKSNNQSVDAAFRSSRRGRGRLLGPQRQRPRAIQRQRLRWP
jgi:hypothetical protein